MNVDMTSGVAGRLEIDSNCRQLITSFLASVSLIVLCSPNDRRLPQAQSSSITPEANDSLQLNDVRAARFARSTAISQASETARGCFVSTYNASWRMKSSRK